jgi:hypothetical protein
MDTAMYGVILWSDPDVRKAVIWCEDSGGLAYYEAPDDPRSIPQEFFDAGDYVEFDMTDDVAPQRACNAHTLRSGRCPRVTRTLQSSGGIPSDAETRLRDVSKGRVITFPGHHTAPQRTAGDFIRRG